jgi:hypothetical protein
LLWESNSRAMCRKAPRDIEIPSPGN